MKKRLLGIILILVMLCGCSTDKENAEATKIQNMMDNYEISIKNYDFEASDSYWINPEDNMYASIVDYSDDAIYLEVCKEIYVEKLDFQISDIKVDGNTATANCDIHICEVWNLIEKIPELYDYDELMKKDKEEMKKEFEQQLEKHIVTWNGGTITFEKVGQEWKIKSIE